MNWLLFAVAILAGEILLVLLFWEKIAEVFASYTYLYGKGEKTYQAGSLEKALGLFKKVNNHPEFQNLPKEHPLKLAVCQYLAATYFELASLQLGQGEKNYGRQYLLEALTYKIKELQITGEWESLQENHPEVKTIRLKLAGAYRYSNFDLPEALKIFFGYGHWEDYIGTYHQLKNQLTYLSYVPEEKTFIEERAELAREILKYRQGVNKILQGNKDGKLEVDRALEAVGNILNHSPDFLQVDEPLFNEIKGKLGLSAVAEMQGDTDEDEAGSRDNDGLLPSQEEVVGETAASPKMDGDKAAAAVGNSWEVIVRQLQKQSRVINKVTQRPGEVLVEVQTEWYLLPLIFQEELVDKVVRTFYALSKKKAGSMCFIFKDNKGREVARHTQLGVRVYG